MITTLSLDKQGLAKNKEFDYFAKSKVFNDKRFSKDGNNVSIEFKKGVNIIVGENGSGKSTLLKMIGTLTASHAGGVSTYTGSWSGDVGYQNNLSGITGKINKLPFYYVDSSHTVGLDSGHFDDDFMSEAIANLRLKGSSGELTVHKITNAIKLLMGQIEPAKEYKDKTDLKWQQQKNNNLYYVLDEIKKNMIESNITTVIFDEPELHVSLNQQALLWKAIWTVFSREEHIQVIVASHSPFAFSNIFSNANYIELNKGYLKKFRDEMANLSFVDTGM